MAGHDMSTMEYEKIEYHRLAVGDSSGGCFSHSVHTGGA